MHRERWKSPARRADKFDELMTVQPASEVQTQFDVRWRSLMQNHFRCIWTMKNGSAFRPQKAHRRGENGADNICPAASQPPIPPSGWVDKAPSFELLWAALLLPELISLELLTANLLQRHNQ